MNDIGWDDCSANFEDANSENDGNPLETMEGVQGDQARVPY